MACFNAPPDCKGRQFAIAIAVVRRQGPQLLVMAPIPGIDMSMRRACFDVHLRQLAPKLGGTDANAAPGFQHQ